MTSRPVRLGIRENLAQFALLVVVNAFVAATIGMERNIVPAIATEEFHLAARAGARVTFPILPDLPKLSVTLSLPVAREDGCRRIREGPRGAPRSTMRYRRPVTPVDRAVLDRLTAALREGPALRLAILFGSRALGTSRPESDFDIGILPMDPALSLAGELALGAALTAAVDREVDVVQLDSDDPLLGREVARSGVCLLEDAPGTFSAYRARATSVWLDFDETVAPQRIATG